MTSQPLVELEIRENLGLVFLEIQAYSDAAPHLLRAVALAAEHQAAPAMRDDTRAEQEKWSNRWLRPLLRAHTGMGTPEAVPAALDRIASCCVPGSDERLSLQKMNRSSEA